MHISKSNKNIKVKPDKKRMKWKMLLINFFTSIIVSVFYHVKNWLQVLYEAENWSQLLYRCHIGWEISLKYLINIISRGKLV